MPYITTALTAQMRKCSPHFDAPFPSQWQYDPSDWQYRNPLSALFPPSDFSSAMTPYVNEYGYPDTSIDDALSSVGFMDRCNNPSYGSDTNQWQPRYSLACETPEAQSLRFLAASFPESSWSGPSATLHHDPTHYQAPFNNNADFYLMAGQQQMSTSIPYSMAAATSAESSMMNSRPETPASVTSYGGNSFDIQSRAITSSSDAELSKQGIYSHQDQLLFFKQALSLPAAGLMGPFVPQQMYVPHTSSDRKRYVEEIGLDAPIYFWMTDPEGCGISLADALHSRVNRLQNRDCPVFKGRGPSVSIRLQWPGYRPWSRQIPTKDFRSPPGPITLAKLAKNIAKCVQRFIEERQYSRLEDVADLRWQVGSNGNGLITLDDIVLVSIHHVSLGSWQPHLRLKRPFDLPARH